MLKIRLRKGCTVEEMTRLKTRFWEGHLTVDTVQKTTTFFPSFSLCDHTPSSVFLGLRLADNVENL